MAAARRNTRELVDEHGRRAVLTSINGGGMGRGFALGASQDQEGRRVRMRSARLSAAFRGSTCVVVLAAVLLPASRPGAQEPAKRFRGAFLVHAVDTSINPLHAEIVMPAFEVSARGDDDGAVLFVNVPDGLYLLHARHLGHRPEWRFVRVTGDTVRVELVLVPADIRRGTGRGTLAESRLREFLRRTTAIPLGTFLTRGEIQRRRARSLVALLAQVTDVTIDRSPNGPPVVRSDRAAGARCASGMLVLVDAVIPAGVGQAEGLTPAHGPQEPRLMQGLRAERRVTGHASRWNAVRPRFETGSPEVAGEPAGEPRATSARRAASPIERIPITRIAAVEVYPTLPGVPPEFQLVGAECGVVLVWTLAGSG